MNHSGFVCCLRADFISDLMVGTLNYRWGRSTSQQEHTGAPVDPKEGAGKCWHAFRWSRQSPLCWVQWSGSVGNGLHVETLVIQSMGHSDSANQNTISDRPNEVPPAGWMRVLRPVPPKGPASRANRFSRDLFLWMVLAVGFCLGCIRSILRLWASSSFRFDWLISTISETMEGNWITNAVSSCWITIYL